MKKIAKYLIISLIISIIPLNLKPLSASAFTLSRAECVMEVSTGRILHFYNENVKLPIASTTKILTAITAIENFDVDREVTVPKKCVGVEGSSVYLRQGEVLSIKELLFGLMLRSGNDCAECIAETTVGRENFIKLMNSTAKKYGAINSNFVNPHGLPDDNHYSTAYDMCIITINAMKNPTFKEIVSTKRVNISNDGYDYDRVLINKNKLLFNYDGCTGVKTGYTKKAGRCLVSSAEKEGMEIVSVVINSPQMWERSIELLDTAYNEYDMIEVFNSENYNNDIKRNYKDKIIKVETSKNFKYPLKNEEKSFIKTLIDGKTELEFYKNPKENAVFEIYYQNKLIFSQNIFTIIYK